jgi:hypothetical protein
MQLLFPIVMFELFILLKLLEQTLLMQLLFPIVMFELFILLKLLTTVWLEIFLLCETKICWPPLLQITPSLLQTIDC